MQTETYELEGQIFKWDRSKQLSNIKKHGITFKTAAKTFFDPNAVTIDDDEHSQNEDRFILIDANEAGKMLTVCHCYRNKNNVVRIISARPANQYEKQAYEDGGTF